VGKYIVSKGSKFISLEATVCYLMGLLLMYVINPWQRAFNGPINGG